MSPRFPHPDPADGGQLKDESGVIGDDEEDGEDRIEEEANEHDVDDYELLHSAMIQCLETNSGDENDEEDVPLEFRPCSV